MFKLRTSPALVAILQTVNLNVMIFGMGCVIGVTGTTLIDLSDIYSTSAENMSYIIMTRGCGSIVSCLLGGFIFKCFNMQHVVIISTLVIGIGLLMTPNWPSLRLCHVFTFVTGGAIGLTEISTNFWIFAIWKEKSGPVLQFLNLCFGLGGIAAPMFAAPFLRTPDQKSAVASYVERTLNVTTRDAQMTEVDIVPSTADTQVMVPYVIIGAVFLLTFISCLVSFCADSSNITVDDKDATDSTASLGWQRLLVTVYCFYVLSIVTFEQTYVSMLALFVVQQLNFTKASSVYVSAVFWVFFTLSRVLATFASFKLQPRHMLYACHALSLVAAGLLCAMGGSSGSIVWLCSALQGFGISPMFPSALTHILDYVHLTQRYTSMVMLCVCAGGMLPPILVGPWLESNSPIAFVYVNFIIAITASAALIGILMLSYGKSIRPSMVRK